MRHINHQFGEFEYEQKHVVDFPEGIIGFEDFKKFIVIDDEDSQPFRWLVSLEDKNFCLPLINPELINESYEIPKLKGNTSVFVIATLREPLENSTINLRSPIIIDNDTQIGIQIILEDEKLPYNFSLKLETVSE